MKHFSASLVEHMIANVIEARAVRKATDGCGKMSFEARPNEWAQ